jgi:hypothetical protein
MKTELERSVSMNNFLDSISDEYDQRVAENIAACERCGLKLKPGDASYIAQLVAEWPDSRPKSGIHTNKRRRKRITIPKPRARRTCDVC